MDETESDPRPDAKIDKPPGSVTILCAIPEFGVTRIDEAIQFFAILGFQAAWTWEESFAAVGNGEVQLYLRKEVNPSPVRCYLHVSDADLLFERCTAHGATIVDPLTSKPWGQREFAVEAPGGHILRIGHGEKRVDEIEEFAVTGDATSQRDDK